MPQCSNCQFQNMPGVTHCGRCGTSLTLRTAVVNVHPPRATRWAKLWRRTFAARLIRPIRETSASLASQWGMTPQTQLPSSGALRRLAVPGWAQVFEGRASLGRSLFFGYLVCLVIAALCFGSPLCSLLLGFAFACHGISVYDVVRRSCSELRARLFLMMLFCGLLAAVIYVPAYVLATRLVAPVIIQLERPPLSAGDVLLVNRSASVRRAPRAGDIVQYELTEAFLMGHTAAGMAARFDFRGSRIDRVLALPGQVIVWNDGRLTVDGQPSPFLPLNPAGAMQKLSFTIPPGCCFILPSTDFVSDQFQTTEENWRSWSTIRIDQIEGRVIWRSWPLTRIGFVR